MYPGQQNPFAQAMQPQQPQGIGQQYAPRYAPPQQQYAPSTQYQPPQPAWQPQYIMSPQASPWAWMQGNVQTQPFPSTQPHPQAPNPAAQYASTMPAARPQPVSAMGAQAHVTPGQAQGANMIENPNPVHQAMGGQLAMSDETKKVLTEHSLADDFLEHMRPYSYKYKDPSMEPRVAPTGGEYLGVMAQDLERIPRLGAQLVVQTPHGKMVDQKTALSATMAGLARVHERVRALEQDALKKGGK